MGPWKLALHKPIDCRGYLHKAFQLQSGRVATIYITLDPKATEQLGRSMHLRSKEGILWTEIVRLTESKPYATHTGLGAALMVDADEGTEVLAMGHS